MMIFDECTLNDVHPIGFSLSFERVGQGASCAAAVTLRPDIP
jgi:hypothetical protein